MKENGYEHYFLIIVFAVLFFFNFVKVLAKKKTNTSRTEEGVHPSSYEGAYGSSEDSCTSEKNEMQNTYREKSYCSKYQSKDYKSKIEKSQDIENKAYKKSSFFKKKDLKKIIVFSEIMSRKYK